MRAACAWRWLHGWLGHPCAQHALQQLLGFELRQHGLCPVRDRHRRRVRRLRRDIRREEEPALAAEQLQRPSIRVEVKLDASVGSAEREESRAAAILGIERRPAQRLLKRRVGGQKLAVIESVTLRSLLGAAGPAHVPHERPQRQPAMARPSRLGDRCGGPCQHVCVGAQAQQRLPAEDRGGDSPLSSSIGQNQRLLQVELLPELLRCDGRGRAALDGARVVGTADAGVGPPAAGLLRGGGPRAATARQQQD